MRSVWPFSFNPKGEGTEGQECQGGGFRYGGSGVGQGMEEEGLGGFVVGEGMFPGWEDAADFDLEGLGVEGQRVSRRELKEVEGIAGVGGEIIKELEDKGASEGDVAVDEELVVIDARGRGANKFHVEYAGGGLFEIGGKVDEAGGVAW